MPGHTKAKTLDKMKFARDIEKLPISGSKKGKIIELVLGIKDPSKMKNGGVKTKDKKKIKEVKAPFPLDRFQKVAKIVKKIKKKKK